MTSPAGVPNPAAIGAVSNQIRRAISIAASARDRAAPRQPTPPQGYGYFFFSVP
jgi:hypothetical protein